MANHNRRWRPRGVEPCGGMWLLAVDDRGRTVPDVTPTFASSDNALVRVSATGWVRSVGPVGSVLVTVSAQAVSRPIPTFVLALPRALQLAPPGWRQDHLPPLASLLPVS